MTDTTVKIEPALSAAIWRDWDMDAGTMGPAVALSNWAQREKPALVVAIANAALPDDDPRKITKGDIQQLRFIADHVQLTHITAGISPLYTVAAKLAALLPPG